MAEITGLILAGGKSTRMGCDKASLPLNGRPMIAWVIDRLGSQVDTLLLNANAPDAALRSLGFPIVADRIADYSGPLAGLHAGLASAQTPLLACVPCDAPLLPRDLVVRLRDMLAASRGEVAVARTPRGVEPTFLVCRTDLAPSIEAFLATGARAFHQWLAQRACIEVFFPDLAAFGNVNTPQEAELVEAVLKSS